MFMGLHCALLNMLLRVASPPNLQAIPAISRNQGFPGGQTVQLGADVGHASGDHHPANSVFAQSGLAYLHDP